MTPKTDQSQKTHPDILALERFLVDNPDLDAIETELAVFNPFETLNLTYAEIRHSNVLAWLLDPRENHGLGSRFLRRFLQKAVSNNRDLLASTISIIELDLIDFGEVEVRREWNRIDLTIICRDERMPFVTAIENKIRSGEHSNQLGRYSEILNRAFPNIPHVQIFLTPDGRPPKDDDDWAVVDYGTVIQCIDLALGQSGGNIGEDAQRFIQQYQSIIRRYIVGGDRIEELCRRIYRQHPRALELIFEHKPDLLSDIRDYLVEWILNQKGEGLIHDSDSKTAIRFTHSKIDPLVPHSSEGWTKTRRLLLFEFSNYYDQLVLRLYIGPGPESDRTALETLFKKDEEFFKMMNRDLRKKWHCAWQRKLLSKKDLEGASLDDLREKIDRGLAVFLSEDLPAILDHFDQFWSPE